MVCSAGNKFKVPIRLTVWGFPLVMCIVLLALWNCSGPGDHRRALVHLEMSTANPPLAPPPYSAGLSMFYICWISVKNMYNFILLSVLLYLLPLVLLTILSLVTLFRALRLFRTKLPASSETRRKILRQNSAFVLVVAVEAVMTVVLWFVQVCLVFLQPGTNHPDPECCPSFEKPEHFALAVLFALFFHGTRGIVTLCVWWWTNSITLKDLRPLFCCYCCGCKTHAFPPHITTPLVKSDSGVNQALRRDAMYCINVGILRVINSDIQQQKEQQGWESMARDDLGLVLEDYLYQEERERGDATLDNSLRQSGQECTLILTLSQPERERTFEFTEVEPDIFSRLRECYCTNLEQFHESFHIQDLQDIESSGMLEKFTEGKSGSFFYFTRDFRFIIKTVTDAEVGAMRQIALPYFRHMKANPDTFLPRFFGLYRVRLAREQKLINVVVMDNIFHTSRKLTMHRKFDLKGSTLGRRVVRGHMSSRDRYKGTLKDLDLQKKICVGADNRARILDQLRLDTDFLARHHIMDYSLLLGIHQHSPHDASPLSLVVKEGQQGGFTVVDELTFGADSKTAESTFGCDGAPPSLSSPETPMVHIPWFRQDFGGLRSSALNHPAGPASEDDANTIELQTLAPAAAQLSTSVAPGSREVLAETYFMGIIDILQEYNWVKKLEHVWKSRILCHKPYSISAINEHDYRRRFIDFMANNFE